MSVSIIKDQLNLVLKNANMQSVSQQQLKAMFPSANRIQTVFLKPNTNLLNISPRVSPHCSFKRCIAIPRQAFTDDTIATLDSGNTESCITYPIISFYFSHT